MNHNSRNPIYHRHPHRMWLQGPIVLLIVLALTAALSACGGDDEIVAGSDDGVTVDDAAGGGTPDGSTDGDTDPQSGGDYQLTESHPELISVQKAPIIGVEAIDDQTLAVRYRNASEPCALANVTVTETGSDVTVLLETGLHPNAAAMTCIAQVIDYEIRVSLDEPLGDRQIVIDGA